MWILVLVQLLIYCLTWDKVSKFFKSQYPYVTGITTSLSQGCYEYFKHCILKSPPSTYKCPLFFHLSFNSLSDPNFSAAYMPQEFISGCHREIIWWDLLTSRDFLNRHIGKAWKLWRKLFQVVTIACTWSEVFHYQGNCFTVLVQIQLETREEGESPGQDLSQQRGHGDFRGRVKSEEGRNTAGILLL